MYYDRLCEYKRDGKVHEAEHAVLSFLTPEQIKVAREKLNAETHLGRLNAPHELHSVASLRGFPDVSLIAVRTIREERVDLRNRVPRNDVLSLPSKKRGSGAIGAVASHDLSPGLSSYPV